MRVAFADALDDLERGIAVRDYYAANYGAGRCQWHLGPVDHQLASAGDPAEVQALRDLAVRPT